MLDSICAAIAAVTYGIQTLANAGKFVFNFNYHFVTTVGHYLARCMALIAHYAGLVKSVLVTVWSNVSYFVNEIYLFLGSVSSMLLKLASIAYEFGSSTYLTGYSAGVAVSGCVGNGYVLIKSAVVDMCSLFAAGASHSVSFVVASVSAVVFLVASLGAACVNFVNGLWYGLGFALSSVASFPTFLTQSADKAWNRLVESVAGVLMGTTKETYLGIIMLCLIYLTLSNFMRFVSCQSLPLFSRRIRRRRQRVPPGANPLQFDRGFESDFDDLYGSDVESRDRQQPPWLNDLNNREIDQVDNNSSSDASDNDDISDNEDAADNANDSDEYTVESDNDEDDDDDDSSDAGSVNSRNSRTYSTGSSEHDIEVQLPPLDQHYSLRSRSSTPARQTGNSAALNSPEDFTWEMERERDKRKCVVCQDEIKSVLVLPCRHLCMCVMCADQIVRSRIPGRRTCPLCRTKITKVMNIYV
ncbi:RING finger protein 26 [Elysia marginata]|uniref:RING finger protein 26 n=1 Tax=Elysia marginata TaxID=1093978 RepID=A0AAV4JNC7_9GAST|nr:RING finger protein 26 [Elysia marginata]